MTQYHVLLTGPPAAGKSTLAHHLRDRGGYVHVSTDDALAVAGGMPYDLMETVDWMRVYVDMGAQTHLALREGRNVVTDALSNSEGITRIHLHVSPGLRPLLSRNELRRLIVSLRVDPDVQRVRMAERGSGLSEDAALELRKENSRFWYPTEFRDSFGKAEVLSFPNNDIADRRRIYAVLSDRLQLALI